MTRRMKRYLIGFTSTIGSQQWTGSYNYDAIKMPSRIELIAGIKETARRIGNKTETEIDIVSISQVPLDW